MNSLPDFVYLLFPVVAFAAAVGGLVWLVSYISGKDKKNSQESERQLATMISSESEAPAQMDEQRDLLCVSRTKDGLVIFVQGQRRRHLQEITDPQVGRETIEAIKAVLEFSEGWLPSMRQQAVPSTVPPEANIDHETFLTQLRRAPAPASNKPPGLLASLQRQTPSNLLDPLHLVDEIDDLVQQRLRERPELAKHHVRLTTGATGGLRVYVDQQAFDAVDDVPNPQIKALVQAAIREWESR